jgi:hypothetical protein
MENIELFEDYLGRVGSLVGDRIKDLDDGTWTAVIALLFSDGFIKELDWSTQMGQTFHKTLSDYFDSLGETND